MTIAFYSCFINHHQVSVADELYVLTKHNCTFVELEPIPESFKRSGYPDFSSKPYVLKAWENADNHLKAKELAISSDVALFGDSSLQYALLRCRNTNKLSFEISERWFKRGWINIFSPLLLKYTWHYHTLFFKKPYYKLCSSAFGAKDQYSLHTFYNRCFKWGYFTKVESSLAPIRSESPTKMMWCARMIKWKHPELPIFLAQKLKEKGYNFEIDMYGNGEMYGQIVSLSEKCNVTDRVKFCGNVPNDQILEEMRKHDIFLFTSDQNEGWGAVANEAMSNGCIIVASNVIGSVPYLIKHKENGFVYNSANAIESLIEQIEWIFHHPEDLISLREKAFFTLHDIWSPQNASRNLLTLINDLINGHECSILEGPCSKAEPI